MKVYDDLAVIILAAGKGSRMKSDLAKVLHKVDNKSMVVHVIESAVKITDSDNIHVVVGHQKEKVKEEIKKYQTVNYAVQTQLLGTGDAVKAALPGLGVKINHVLVLCGDVPLIQAETLGLLIEGHLQADSKVSVLATDVEDPTGYGRILADENGKIQCIKEEADADEIQKQIKKVNTGIYCIEKNALKSGIEQIQPDNNQAEYYLTDVVEIAKNKGEKTIAITMDNPDQVIGVNTLKELARAEELIHTMGV